ncbi:hypothetical protein, partial [Mycobacterium persicum]|uniref:hypothetical protein n=1 Tax=Mycobacterium persicum TaxID=1487726 RepID=UPI001ABF6A4D
PTTLPDRYWKPVDSDPNYTLDCEEPHILLLTSFNPAAACSRDIDGCGGGGSCFQVWSTAWT